MLVNELSTGEEILKQLAGASLDETMLSPDEVNEQIKNFKHLCIKARQAWALAVFSGASHSSLERYFTYHLQLLSDLSVKLRSLPIYPVVTCSCSPQETLNNIFENELDSLTYHLLHFFRDYPDKSITAPLSYIAKFIKNLEPDITDIMQSPALCLLPGPLNAIILSYLKEMSRPIQCTFGDLLYFEKFIAGIKPALEKPDVLVDKLMELEFNQVQVLAWFQGEALRELKGKTAEKKLGVIRKRTALSRVYHKADKEVYDPCLPPLTQMFAGWLAEEEKAFKEVIAAEMNARHSTGQKFRLPLSVAQVACFLRLSLKENLVGAPPLTEVFDFVCSAFSTKRANDLSPGGLSKAYYSISQVTAAEVKYLLAKMINIINHDYFPALAAIGVLICAR